MKNSETFLFNLYSKMHITILHNHTTDFFTLAFILSLTITGNFATIKYENKENYIAEELKILGTEETTTTFLLQAESVAQS